LSKLLYVVGTDTGIGKTVVSLLIMQYLFSKGFNPFYLKPFQTGCSSPIDIDSDARFIYTYVPKLMGKDPSLSVGYCFKNPKAPYFSAIDDRKKIDIKFIKDIIKKQAIDHSHIVIEGSGGLLVPVTDNILIIDTIRIFEATPILIAKAGLGTINHTLLSLEALINRNMKPLAIILVNNDNTPSSMIKENMQAIKMFSGIEVIGVVNNIRDFYYIENDKFAFLDNINL